MWGATEDVAAKCTGRRQRQTRGAIVSECPPFFVFSVGLRSSVCHNFVYGGECKRVPLAGHVHFQFFLVFFPFVSCSFEREGPSD
jgi:hypothetical protein